MKYKLGLDMGATSIGWAVVNAYTQELIDTGVRIFDDGRDDKTKKPLCVKRRLARGMRRQTDRRVMRLQAVLALLQQQGLFPTKRAEMEALKNQNPYRLRAEALDRDLEPQELGRVLLQLAKRRGFRSNRKDSQKEGGKLKNGYEDLQARMTNTGARTYGEFLYRQEQAGQTIRLKNVFDDKGEFLGGMPFPFREVYMKEFDAVRKRQAGLMPAEVWDRVREIIFFQRPLKDVEEGNCPFEKGEKRIPRAHPLFQEFRIRQAVLNLKFQEPGVLKYRELTHDEGAALLEILQHPLEADKKGLLSYAKIKKALGLNKKGTFNFEGRKGQRAGEDKGILTDTTEWAMTTSAVMKPYWERLSPEQRGDLIEVLFRPGRAIGLAAGCSLEVQDQKLREVLQERFGINAEATEELLNTIVLEDGVGSLSAKAIRKLLNEMETGMMYRDACEALGYCQGDGVRLDRLPYYGVILSDYCIGRKDNPKTDEEHYGKINNVTVHVALNQTRHLVNELIAKYGKPGDIAIEYGRELAAGSDERNKIEANISKNEKENQRIITEIKEKIGIHNPSKSDVQKYKIWENMGKNPDDRRCPYTGKQIGVADLMNGELFQIEHLIPFGRSLDDSMANKVIACSTANRYKGNRTPWEAFHESRDGYNWDAIQAWAKKLKPAQQWRFEQNAMERFGENAGPIARALNDTRYMTRILQTYLRPIVDEKGKKTVQAVPGRLTELVRKAWDLNLYKNKANPQFYRERHNHHAIDAYVVAAISRQQIATTVEAMLKDIDDKTALKEIQLADPTLSEAERKILEEKFEKMISERRRKIVQAYFPRPGWQILNDARDKIKHIAISHKPSLKNAEQANSTVGQLHEETAWGLVGWTDEAGLTGVFRGPGKTHKEVNITTWVPMFREAADKKAYYDAFRAWFIQDGKARAMKPLGDQEQAEKSAQAKEEQESVQTLRRAAEKAFKWFVGGNNYCAEIYEINPQNKTRGVPTRNRGDWESEIVSNYHATVRRTRGEEIAYWRYKYPNARRVMTLKRNDMVRATFTREEALSEAFPKGIQDYVRAQFDALPDQSEIHVLFRVKKIGSNGQISLTPHDIAKEEADTKSFRSTASSLKKYRVRRVLVTYTGEVRDAGPNH